MKGAICLVIVEVNSLVVDWLFESFPMAQCALQPDIDRMCAMCVWLDVTVHNALTAQIRFCSHCSCKNGCVKYSQISAFIFREGYRRKVSKLTCVPLCKSSLSRNNMLQSPLQDSFVFYAHSMSCL